MIDSLKQFLAEYKSENWNPEKTQRLISLLETSSCTSCHTKQSHADQYEKNKGSLFLSDTSVFKHKHWVSVVLINSWIIVGNRNTRSVVPGARFFKSESPFYSFFEFAKNYAKRKAPGYCFDLELPEQYSGSCSMVSFEAGIMGALFAMMIEDPINNVTKAKEEAQSIFNAWHKESQISLLKQIIVEDGEGYDPSALTKALGRFDACEQTAQRFWDFLVSKGITPWKEGAALKYVLQKNDTFLRLMAKNIKGEKEVHILWNHCPIFKKHYITEIFYKNGISFPSTQSTFISITCKIPSGNRLFIRGSGNGLNWENGSPLTRCNDSIWIYVSPVPLEDMEYKFFINDKIGHEGDNHKIIDGKIDGRSPHFILPPNLGTSLKTHGKS